MNWKQFDNAFDEWWESPERERKFHTGQFSDKQIAYAGAIWAVKHLEVEKFLDYAIELLRVWQDNKDLLDYSGDEEDQRELEYFIKKVIGPTTPP